MPSSNKMILIINKKTQLMLNRIVFIVRNEYNRFFKKE